MAVYNELPYLNEAIESVLHQTYGDFEFIIIDDGSTDGSTAVLQRYADRDERIRLVERENRGLTPSLNQGLRMANGEYIARMDGDDICLPNRFGLQVKYLDVHPKCVLAGGGVIPIGADGNRITQGPQAPKQGNAAYLRMEYEHEDIDEALLTGKWTLVHPSVMMRKRALEEVGMYRGKYVDAEDRDLFLRLAEVGILANLRENVLKYRCHPGQVSNQSVEQRYWSKRARRAAHRRRGRALPSELRLPAIARSAAGKELKKLGLYHLAVRLLPEVITGT